MMCDAYGIGGEFDAISAIAHSQRATLKRSLGRLQSGESAGSVAYAQSSVEWIRGQLAWLDAHWGELEAAMG